MVQYDFKYVQLFYTVAIASYSTLFQKLDT